MSRSDNRLSIPAAIAIVAVGVIALIGSGALRPSAVSGTPPSETPWVPSVPPAAPVTPAEPGETPWTPSVPPVTPATPAPATPEPTPAADDFSDLEKTVKLDVADPHNVNVHVKDFIGNVVDATTGRAGDGMSVRWNTLKVENLDDDTLRLTWVGPPTDDPVKVIVANTEGEASVKPTIVLFQLQSPPNSDAIGFDRVLDLHFEAPVSADDFNVAVQEGYDTDD
jgi:hypothetical protein